MEIPLLESKLNFDISLKSIPSPLITNESEESSPISSIFIGNPPVKYSQTRQMKNLEIKNSKTSPDIPILTIADLERSDNERNLLAFAKSSRRSDTFNLSKTTERSSLKSELAVRFAETEDSDVISSRHIKEEVQSNQKIGINYKKAENQTEHSSHCPTCNCYLGRLDYRYLEYDSKKDLDYISNLGGSSLLKSKKLANKPRSTFSNSNKVLRPYAPPYKNLLRAESISYVSPIFKTFSSPSHIFRERLNQRVIDSKYKGLKYQSL